MNTAQTPSRLLRLLHLASPALPIGSFAFSQGLEWAIEEGRVNTETALADWWEGLISEGLACTDVPLLIRLHSAWEQNDPVALAYWNEQVLALRETRELREEELQIGRALLRLLASLDVPQAQTWQKQPATLLLAWALAAHSWQIPARDAVLAYLWAWLENQVVAAGKILPLAQTPAQQILLRMDPVLLAACERGEALPDEAVGQSLPGWSHACARHETQYSRLFRS